MTREAEIIEAQLKAKQGGGGGASQPGMPQQAAAVAAAVAAAQNASNGGGPGAGGAAGGADYSAQWAEYYRAVGKIEEAEAIEKQMNASKVRNLHHFAVVPE